MAMAKRLRIPTRAAIRSLFGMAILLWQLGKLLAMHAGSAAAGAPISVLAVWRTNIGIRERTNIGMAWEALPFRAAFREKHRGKLPAGGLIRQFCTECSIANRYQSSISAKISRQRQVRAVMVVVWGPVLFLPERL